MRHGKITDSCDIVQEDNENHCGKVSVRNPPNPTNGNTLKDIYLNPNFEKTWVFFRKSLTHLMQYYKNTHTPWLINSIITLRIISTGRACRFANSSFWNIQKINTLKPSMQ